MPLITNTAGFYFDEVKHKYYCNGKELDNVTSWIDKSFCTPFENKGSHIFKSQAKAKKNKADQSGITNPEVLRYVWKLQSQRAATVGTAVHTYAHLLHIHRQYGTDYHPIIGYDRAVYDAYNFITKEWDIISVEKQVYDLQYLIAGTIDVTLQHKTTKKIGILDWKTFENPDKAHGKMINEMKGLPDCGRTKGAIQMELYDIIGNMKSDVSNRFLVWVRASGTYELLGTKENPLPAIRPQLMTALNKRLLSKTDITKLI
jgi:hypothetical protein